MFVDNEFREMASQRPLPNPITKGGDVMKRALGVALCCAVLGTYSGVQAAEEGGLYECEVQARAGWQTFDLTARRGKSYLVTAMGEWTTAPSTHKFGPDGGGATAGFGFFKVNTRFALGCLMAAVGDEDFEIGSFKVITPEDNSGSLKFRMNDSATDDNEGSVHVTIEELSPEEARNYEGAFRVRPNLGKDDPNSGWQRSNLTVRQGESITLKLRGKWTTSFATTPFGPEGGGMTESFGEEAARDFRLVKDAKVGALLGRVGYSGRPFAVSPDAKRTVTIRANESGPLLFNINDTLQLDNGGAIIVIPVTKK